MYAAKIKGVNFKPALKLIQENSHKFVIFLLRIKMRKKYHLNKVK